ncbi:MAG TPA: peptidase S8 [Armatimonadetes bacterium]|nr:peptidase S8 [Armatimonadota bacterium]
MLGWIRKIWRLFGMMGTALSLGRWWRMVTNSREEARRRLIAAVLIGVTIGFIVLAWKERRGSDEQAVKEMEVYEGEIVVDLVDEATERQIEALEREYGIDLVFNSVHAHEERLMRAKVGGRFKKGGELLRGLRRERLVEAADWNYVYRALWVPNDPRYKDQWHMKMIGMEKAWDVARGRGVVVAVIDTGVAFEDYGRFYRARDLRGTKFVKGYDFVNDDEHPNDDHGHGTHVTGTIAQTTNNREGVTGIAFEAAIMPLKVLNRYGFGNLADIADAIRFAADEGAQVINMSLGGPRPSLVLEEACKYAVRKGVTIVCAAGNSGREGVSYPAAYRECVAVSAVGPDGELAPYSSYGKEIEIAAPGGNKLLGEEAGVLQNTIVPRDDYYYYQGTSMASPHVAGVAALLVSLGVRKPEGVRRILRGSAKRKGDEKRYGAGLLDAAAAVRKAAEEMGVRVGSEGRKGGGWWWWVGLGIGVIWWWRRVHRIR